MRSSWLALLALSFALPAQATVIEVPVPELLVTLTTGNPDNYKRTVVVRMPAVPSVIRSVSMRMRGTATYTYATCPDEQALVPMDLSTTLFENEPYTLPYVDFDSHPVGQFSLTRKFEHYPVSDYAFLLDGTANLQIGAYGPGFVECVAFDSATVRFDEVTLLIDGDFPTAAATPSWGLLKAIYR